MYMLKGISWGMFGITIGSLTLVYYACVAVRYYAPSLLSAAKSAGKPGAKAGSTPELYPIVHDLVDEMHAFLESSAGKLHESLLFPKIAAILAKYPAVKDSSYREAITDLVASEVTQYGSTPVTKEQVADLW
jgi:hypothetical protein